MTVTKKKCGELVINIPTNLQITYTSSKAGEIMNKKEINLLNDAFV